MIDINFGDKAIRIREWKGKERRILQQSIDNDTLTPSLIDKILIADCCEVPKFLTANEANYVYYLMYLNCFDGSIAVDWECSSCGERNNSIMDIKKLLEEAEKSNLKEFETSEGVFVFGELQYNETIMNVFDQMTSEVDKLFLNLLLSIKEIRTTDGQVHKPDVKQLEEIMELLPINDFDKLVDYVGDNSFKFSPVQICECESCKEKTAVYCDYLPSLLK